MLTTPTTIFYYKFHERNTGGAPNMSMGEVGSNSGIQHNYTWSHSPTYSQTVTIPMYSDGNSTYELTKKNFIEVLSKALAADPSLVQKIQDKEFKLKDLDDIFDEYTQETAPPKTK